MHLSFTVRYRDTFWSYAKIVYLPSSAVLTEKPVLEIDGPLLVSADTMIVYVLYLQSLDTVTF